MARANPQELIDAFELPALVMQSEPRQVVTANSQAGALFGKDLEQIAGRRGGQVFNCLHSFTDAGCGKDINCEHCKIKNAVVETFLTGQPHCGVQTILQIKKHHGVAPYEMQVSTGKVGDFVVVTIDQYQQKA